MDIFVISETKIDESFPMSQYSIEGYTTPFRLDRNDEVGEIIIYIREDIPCEELKNLLLIEGVFIEFGKRNRKWILFGGYNPQKEHISYFLNHIEQSLDKLIGNYDNIILIGDFNFEVGEADMSEVCENYSL